MSSRPISTFFVWKAARWSVLGFMLIAFTMMLKRPSALAAPLPPSLAREHSQQFQSKWSDLELAHQRGESAEARFTAEEISAVLEYPGRPGQIALSGDKVTGQFVATVHGKDVYVTISGQLGAADGYLTFQPAELRIGDMPVPVAILKGPLQTKLSEPETHARLKLPEYISDLRIENGQLVVIEK